MRFTDTAGLLPHLAREEAERRHQYYLGPEHLLLGLLVEEDNPRSGSCAPTGCRSRSGTDAAQNVRLRPAQSFPRAPGAGTPLICWRVFVLVRKEAAARGEDITPAHWLLALLRDAEDPVDVDLEPSSVERRKRSMFGLPDHGPSPVRLLVESHGLTLDQLRAAVLEELDRSEG
jgi:hypothetical protein